MYLKKNFKIIGKAIVGHKLVRIIKRLPENILLNCNDISSNINVFSKSKKGLTQLGYIDIGGEEYIEF